MFTLLNTYGINRINQSLINQKKTVLFKEAELISSEYMTNYFKNKITPYSLTLQLETIDTFLDARIWIVNKEGVIVSDSRPNDNNTTGLNVNNLDPGFLEKNYNEGTTFGDLFSEPMLSIIQPVTMNFEIKGYIVIHTSMTTIENASVYYMDFINTCFLIFLIVMLLVFCYIYYLTIIPLKKIIKAAVEYTSGHFDYPLEIKTHDEYRDLSNAITYMAGEINNLDDYQKKFVANISHDFRSPLTSIKGYAEAILDGTIPAESQGKYLGIILFETERLTKLTTNLLTLNSFENNATLLDIVTFDINLIIKRTAESFEGICTKKKIKLKLVFAEKEIFVDADMGKIQQVLYNLIDNAVKFSHSDSEIKISTEEKNDKVFVSVKDYGIGIPKESIKKVWERFYKSDASRGKDKKGTGLGLSITKEIINAHNENINVISTEGVGTEFIFSLAKGREV
jgi:Signal transduction histidine kinase